MANAAALLCVISCVVTTFASSALSVTQTQSANFRAHAGFRNVARTDVVRFDVTSKIHCSVRCMEGFECSSLNLGPVGLNSGGMDGSSDVMRSCELLTTSSNSIADVTVQAGWTLMESKMH